jgi:hypothetical protein
MKPRITVLTLGVDNVERSMTFYRDGLRLRRKASSAANRTDFLQRRHRPLCARCRLE